MRQDPELIRRLEYVAVPICQAHGVELVDARFHYERGAILRILIEKPLSANTRSNNACDSGVSLQDCQEVTRDILVALDVENDWKFRGDFRIEVSSPGLDRPLYKLEDFERFLGKEVRIQTDHLITGRRRFRGHLLAVKGDDIHIEQDSMVVTIPYTTIIKANLIPEY